MRRLDGLSAFMIYSERPKSYQHTLKVAVLDYGEQAMPSYEALVSDFSENIKRLPMLRWKLARVPFGLNHPVWVQAEDFDIRYHLRHVTCPAPGDDRAFSQLVSQLYAYPMDQSAPLWLTWIVDGLADGKTAVVTLVHHAYTDGTGAARMLERLLLPARAKQYPVAELDAVKNPGKLRLFVNGLVDLPLLFARELPGILRGARTLSRYNKARLASGQAMPPGPDDAPYSPFNTALTHRRTFAYKTFSLADIKAISKRMEVSINDLFVAVCAGAFREFLQDSDFDLDARPMVCTLPVNLRPPPEEDDLVGNQVGTGYMWVPSHIADPRERLQATHEAAQTMKSYLAATSDVNISRVMQLLPPLYAKTMGWIFDRTRGKVNLAGNLVLSNVAGPTKPLNIGKATVSNWLSIGQVSGGVGLNITVWSYAGNFNVCLMADAQVVPDGWVLLDCISNALDQYRETAQEQRPELV
ncbi:MAG: wax ester/triacylglycerol synthase family O-acyltransferase [Halioglobus sp.]